MLEIHQSLNFLHIFYPVPSDSPELKQAKTFIRQWYNQTDNAELTHMSPEQFSHEFSQALTICWNSLSQEEQLQYGQMTQMLTGTFGPLHRQ